MALPWPCGTPRFVVRAGDAGSDSGRRWVSQRGAWGTAGGGEARGGAGRWGPGGAGCPGWGSVGSGCRESTPASAGKASPTSAATGPFPGWMDATAWEEAEAGGDASCPGVVGRESQPWAAGPGRSLHPALRAGGSGLAPSPDPPSWRVFHPWPGQPRWTRTRWLLAVSASLPALPIALPSLQAQQWVHWGESRCDPRSCGCRALTVRPVLSISQLPAPVLPSSRAVSSRVRAGSLLPLLPLPGCYLTLFLGIGCVTRVSPLHHSRQQVQWSELGAPPAVLLSLGAGWDPGCCGGASRLRSSLRFGGGGDTRSSRFGPCLCWGGRSSVASAWRPPASCSSRLPSSCRAWAHVPRRWVSH